MLTYRMLKQLFPSTRGIVDDTIKFYHVFVDPYQQAPKGLFVPLMDAAESLKIAIEHGAIASLWQEGMDLPRYIPNHFPVFFVPSPLQGLQMIVETYQKTQEAGNETIFSLTIHHNEQSRSYDIAVMDQLKQLQQKWFSAQGQEGCERSC